MRVRVWEIVGRTSALQCTAFFSMLRSSEVHCSKSLPEKRALLRRDRVMSLDKGRTTGTRRTGPSQLITQKCPRATTLNDDHRRGCRRQWPARHAFMRHRCGQRCAGLSGRCSPFRAPLPSSNHTWTEETCCRNDHASPRGMRQMCEAQTSRQPSVCKPVLAAKQGIWPWVSVLDRRG